MAERKITDEQLIQEREAGLTLREIAEKYGMNIRTVEGRSGKLAKRGWGHGNSPAVMDYVPDGYAVKGTSTFVDKFGNQLRQWIKTDVDKERQLELLQAAMDGFVADMPRAEPVDIDRTDYHKTLSLYPVFDLHIGALAHKHECGENYSTDIAERIMRSFFDYTVDTSPPSEIGVVLLGGDLLHSDGLDSVTPSSGHVLDQDSRYAKLVYVAMRATRYGINKMLTKHKSVQVKILEGNHDQSGMIWLRAAMAAFYENEPRVDVDTSPRVMHHTQYGKTFLAYTHGHTMRKPETRLSAAAADWRKDFGASEYVYTHSGHLHHQTITETSLGIDEVHGQLGAKDAYSARGGWRSQRRASVIIYSPEYGEIGRFIFRPEMIK